MFVASQYSFRLLQDYAAPLDWKGAFERARGRVSVIAGADDQLMDAAAYQRALPPLGVPVTILPGVDHMGIVYRPEAIKAIVAALAALTHGRLLAKARRRRSASSSPNSAR